MQPPDKNIIEVVPYDSEWITQFEVESKKIKEALGDNCITVHHVGSTAVPGLWAKPIIDMIPVVKNIFEVDQRNRQMESLNYLVKGESGMLFRRYFQRKSSLPACNIHVYEEGSGEIERLTKLRDFLKANADYREEYSNLKRKISAQTNDITDYTLSKDGFIKIIDELTGFNGTRIVHALSNREWEGYYRILQETIKSMHGSTFDKTHSEIKDTNNDHLVMYKGTHVIGAALIALNATHNKEIKYLGIDKHYQGQGYENQFRQDIKKWLEHSALEQK